MQLSYEPSSPYFGRQGYYGSLSAEQQNTLEAVQRFVVDEDIDLSDLALNSLAPQLTILRYLRANKFDELKTTEHIRRNVDWRIEHNVKGLIDMSPEEILGCDMDTLVSVFPHWQCGFDEAGRPVMYKQYSKLFQVDKLLQITTLDAIKKYHIWEQEACCRLCYEQSLKIGHIVETVSALVDIQGLSMTQLSKDFLAIVKSIAEIDQEQYPETLGKTYIINTPYAFPFVWRIVRPWLDPVTVSKINIFGSDYDETLKRDIGIHALPLTYNGTRPALSPEVHPYSSIVYCNGEDYSGDQVTIFGRMMQFAGHDRHEAESVHSRESNGIFPTGDEETGDGMIHVLSTTSSSTITSSKFADAIDVYRGYTLGPGGLHQSWGEELSFHHAHDTRPPPQRRSSVVRRFDNWMIPSFLQKKPVEEVRKMNLRLVIFSLFVSLSCVGVSSYALSSLYATSANGVQMQMWSGVVMLCFSCFLCIINFIAFVGTYTSNSPLLRLFTVCLSFLFVVFVVVGIMSLIEGYSHIEDDDRQYEKIVGWVGIGLSVLSVGPYVMSRTLIKMFNDAMELELVVSSDVIKLKIHQYRSVLLFSQIVTFVVAIAMIGYSAATLDFLIRINFQYPLFAVYALFYAGVTVILGCGFGIWAAYSSFFSIQRIYYLVIVPTVSLAVLGTSAASILQMTQISEEMNKSYEDLKVQHDKYSQEDLETIIQVELLVGAVLCISTFLYQSVCAFSSMKLNKLLLASREESDRELEDGGHSGRGSRRRGRRGRIILTFKEKIIVAFSLLTSFMHIYVSGTFVLFATNINSSSWMLAIWRTMGKYDSRYTSSDPFLVSSNGFMAFVVGPLLLLYVWTIVNKHPVRQVCGIITYSLEIYTYILYFAIAIHSRNTISVQNRLTFVLLFLGLNLMGCLIPVWIVVKEVRTVVAKTRASRYKPLDSQLDDEDDDRERADVLPSGSTGGGGGAVELILNGESLLLADMAAASVRGSSSLHGKKEIHVQCDATDMSLYSTADDHIVSDHATPTHLRSRGGSRQQTTV